MKLAMNMIRQYADIPVTPEEYTQRMIMTGTAVEGTEDISGGMEKVVVGRVRITSSTMAESAPRLAARGARRATRGSSERSGLSPRTGR